jgi:hypothetical protein
MKPGDLCLAPPPYLDPDKVEAIYRGPAQPTVISELGRPSSETIPRVRLEYDGEVYVVDASSVEPLAPPERSN